MGPISPCSKLIYLVGIYYYGRIDSRFAFVHKGVLVNMLGFIRVSEQGL